MLMCLCFQEIAMTRDKAFGLSSNSKPIPTANQGANLPPVPLDGGDDLPKSQPVRKQPASRPGSASAPRQASVGRKVIPHNPWDKHWLDAGCFGLFFLRKIFQSISEYLKGFEMQIIFLLMVIKQFWFQRGVFVHIWRFVRSLWTLKSLLLLFLLSFVFR